MACVKGLDSLTHKLGYSSHQRFVPVALYIVHEGRLINICSDMIRLQLYGSFIKHFDHALRKGQKRSVRGSFFTLKALHVAELLGQRLRQNTILHIIS